MQSTYLELFETIKVCNDWVSKMPRLCNKLSLFKMPWQMLKVLPQLSSLDPSLPYLRPFQWGASNEVLYDPIAQGLSKVWQFKVEKSTFIK